MEKLNSVFDRVYDLTFLICKTMLIFSHTSRHSKVLIFSFFFNMNLFESFETLFSPFQYHVLLCLTATLHALKLNYFNETLLHNC